MPKPNLVNDDLCLIYITAKDSDEAKKISDYLLKQRLIACSNIITDISSHYIWNKNLENSNECLILLKTCNHLFSKIEDEVEKLHSYDCPSIFSIPVNNCSKKYKQWVLSQLGDKK